MSAGGNKARSAITTSPAAGAGELEKDKLLSGVHTFRCYVETDAP